MKGELLDSMLPKIARALEDGSDYRPDWRHLLVQDYLKSIDQSDSEPLARLNEILSQESDPFVRDLLLFYCHRRCSNEEGTAYAVNCQRHNIKTRSASVIRAMVIANVSPERIAYELGTTKEKIEIFEKLYFDARRYLKHRVWLRGICYPADMPNEVNATELRWLAVAFLRGWPGVEEVVLRQVPKIGERNLQRALSMLLGRVEDYCSGLEASGAPPSEKDIKAIAALGRIQARGLPLLLDNLLESEPSTDSPAISELKKLTAAQRQRVRSLFTRLMEAATKKALDQNSENQSDQQVAGSNPAAADIKFRQN